jgi:hypothetical protein
MAKAAMTELQLQIEAVRREASAAGYAAAMQVISELASRPAPKAGTTAAAPSRRGRGRVRQAAPAVKPTRSRRTRATAPTRPSSADGGAQRGTNALIIEEILKAIAPSPVRPAEIRRALQDNGVAISFASIRNALGQLEARNAAEQVGDKELASPRRHSLKQRSAARRGLVRCSPSHE